MIKHKNAAHIKMARTHTHTRISCSLMWMRWNMLAITHFTMIAQWPTGRIRHGHVNCPNSFNKRRTQRRLSLSAVRRPLTIHTQSNNEMNNADLMSLISEAATKRSPSWANWNQNPSDIFSLSVFVFLYQAGYISCVRLYLNYSIGRTQRIRNSLTLLPAGSLFVVVN